MATLAFPQQASSAAAWRQFLKTANMDTAELLAYVYQLYERERAMSTRYHQVLLALAQLADGYTPSTESASALVLSQCVDCGQSVVVDGADYGRFLPCGHVMHSFCMATYCETGQMNTAPGCRCCGVRFLPDSCNVQSQLEVAKVLTAVRVVNGTPLTDLRKDFEDNGYQPSTELDHLIMQDSSNALAAAKAIIDAHKAFLRQLATTVAERLIPTVNEPWPFPALPTAVAFSGASSAEPAPKKAFSAVPMPPTLEPDVLPPEGATVTKGTRYQSRAIMFTSFSSKCKTCKRQQEQGRSIIASGDNGFACCICVFGKTSAAVYAELTPSVDSML